MTRGIYLIKNTLNNKVYVGRSVQIELRTKQHISLLVQNQHANKHLQNSWNKYGEEAFTFEILDTDISEDSELSQLEQLYIDQYQSNNPERGYNKADASIDIAQGDPAMQEFFIEVNDPEFRKPLFFPNKFRKNLLIPLPSTYYRKVARCRNLDKSLMHSSLIKLNSLFGGKDCKKTLWILKTRLDFTMFWELMRIEIQ